MGSASPGDVQFPPGAGAPGSPPAWRNSTSSHRRAVRDGPVELVFPVRMLLNMLFITLRSMGPCNEVPREDVLSRLGRGKSCVFILWILTRVTETISLFKSAARMPGDKFVAHLSQMYRLFHSLCTNLTADIHFIYRKSIVLYIFR